MLQILINGRNFETNSCFTIQQLIHYLGLLDCPLAVELNDVFLSRQEWDKITINTLDTIELVTIVGGG